MDARGAFNYERLGPADRKNRSVSGAAVPLHVILKQLTVEKGSVTLADHRKARLLTVQDAGFRSAFDIEGGTARGSGEANIATVSLGDLLFLRSVRAPLTLSKDTVKLALGRGGGRHRCRRRHRSLEGGRYVARLEVKGVDMAPYSPRRSHGSLGGTLAANATSRVRAACRP
jgi:hypothetical protein